MSRAYVTKVCTGLSVQNVDFIPELPPDIIFPEQIYVQSDLIKKNGQAGWHISRRISKASCSTGYPRKQDKKDFTKDKKQTKIPSRMIWSKFF